MNNRNRPFLIALLLLALLACGTPTPASPDAPQTELPSVQIALDRLDLLLERYVVGNDVRYDAWRSAGDDRMALRRIILTLEESSRETHSVLERQALQINLYNTVTLELVLDGAPRESIRDLSRLTLGFGVFHAKRLHYKGEKMSLDTLEDRLRAESQDPRVHFAVNCASNSCPALLNESFRAERLDEQLERQSHAFLLREDAILLTENKLLLSKIFDWYADDFGGHAGVLEFVERYAPTELATQIREHREQLRVEHMSYDWALNRAP